MAGETDGATAITVRATMAATSAHNEHRPGKNTHSKSIQPTDVHLGGNVTGQNQYIRTREIVRAGGEGGLGGKGAGGLGGKGGEGGMRHIFFYQSLTAIGCYDRLSNTY